MMYPQVNYEFIQLEHGSHFIKKIKKHWWSSWKTEMDGNIPTIYYCIDGEFKRIF